MSLLLPESCRHGVTRQQSLRKIVIKMESLVMVALGSEGGGGTTCLLTARG